MRRLALTLIIAGLTCPAAATAGTHAASFEVAQEHGVTVYRGQASQYNQNALSALQEGHKLRAEQARQAAKLSTVQRTLAAQQRSIDTLEARQSQQDAQSQPKRRARYGRSYIGNNRFFGSNGFIGNSW